VSASIEHARPCVTDGATSEWALDIQHSDQLDYLQHTNADALTVAHK
jgi:hypothetical protein